MSCHNIGLADGGWDDILHRHPHVRALVFMIIRASWSPAGGVSLTCRGQSGINPMQPRCFVRLEEGKKTINPPMSWRVHAQRTMLGERTRPHWPRQSLCRVLTMPPLTSGLGQTLEERSQR